MSLDEVIFLIFKEFIKAIFISTKNILDSIYYGILYNPIIYLFSFYIGFLIGWYIFGFLFGKLRRPFSFIAFVGSLLGVIYFSDLFGYSGFIAGIIFSLILMDIIKFIFTKLGYDYSELTTRKIALYFWILPLIIKILWDKIRLRKLYKEQFRIIQENSNKSLERYFEEFEKRSKEEEKQKRKIDKILNEKLENLLKKLDRF